MWRRHDHHIAGGWTSGGSKRARSASLGGPASWCESGARDPGNVLLRRGGGQLPASRLAGGDGEMCSGLGAALSAIPGRDPGHHFIKRKTLSRAASYSEPPTSTTYSTPSRRPSSQPAASRPSAPQLHSSDAPATKRSTRSKHAVNTLYSPSLQSRPFAILGGSAYC